MGRLPSRTVRLAGAAELRLSLTLENVRQSSPFIRNPNEPLSKTEWEWHQLRVEGALRLVAPPPRNVAGEAICFRESVPEDCLRPARKRGASSAGPLKQVDSEGSRRPRLPGGAFSWFFFVA